MGVLKDTHNKKALYDYALLLLNEAEANILDSYSGTSFESKYRRTYNAKRGRLKRLGRNVGLEV